MKLAHCELQLLKWTCFCHILKTSYGMTHILLLENLSVKTFIILIFHFFLKWINDKSSLYQYSIDISLWKPSEGKLLNELNESLYPVELLIKPWKFRFRRKKISGKFWKFWKIQKWICSHFFCLFELINHHLNTLIDAYLKMSLFTINYINRFSV